MPVPDFKLQHFFESQPGEEYPLARELEPSSISRIREAIKTSIGIGNDLREFPQYMAREGAPLADCPVTERTDLRPLLSGHDLSAEEVTVFFIGNEGLDRGYEANLNRLCRYLDHVWYPPADDLLVVDRSLGWMLFLPHWGAASFLRLASE